MPNKNYRAGRALEYKIMKLWRDQGFIALRTAGSHGFADVITVFDNFTPTFIQAKRVSKATEAHRLADAFVRNPPLNRSQKYRQQIVIQVKGSRELITETV